MEILIGILVIEMIKMLWSYPYTYKSSKRPLNKVPKEKVYLVNLRADNSYSTVEEPF